MTLQRAELVPHTLRSVRTRGWIQLAVLAILVWAIYRHTFGSLWTVWMGNPNYSHGWLVPLVSLFLVWLRRKELLEKSISPSAWGLPVIVAAVGLQLAGLRGDVLILQGDSVVLLIAGLVLHFAGTGWFRVLAFPIGYLVFMVPFLPLFQNLVSFRLKQLASTGAVVVSGWLGVLIQQDGMSLYLPTGAMRIENACSGMQSLISLMALAAVVAYLANGSWIRKSLLFLAAIPIALFVNVIRISALCVVGNASDIETATGLFHDVSGYVLFGVGLGLLLLTRRLLRC